MMSENNHIPSPALALGLGGLLPFIASAILCCWPDAPIRDFGEFALRTYGAVILSFLGGIKWGVLINDQAGLQQWKPITLSVVPSLIAWPALLLPALPGLALLLVGLVLQYCLDRASVEQQSLPRWFGKLRFILTCGAVGAIATGVLAHLFLQVFTQFFAELPWQALSRSKVISLVIYLAPSLGIYKTGSITGATVSDGCDLLPLYTVRAILAWQFRPAFEILPKQLRQANSSLKSRARNQSLDKSWAREDAP